MEEPPPRVLLYILRHDIRLSDNPIFYAASAYSLKTNTYTKSTQSIDTPVRNDPFISNQDFPAFTHLLPVYVFPANQVEVSGFIPDPTTKSPYPQATSHVAGFWRTGHHRARFMAEGLWDLKFRLEQLGCGSGLQVRVGRAGEVVEGILEWYTKEKGAGRSKVEVAGIWMTAEEGKEEKDEEANVRRVAYEKSVPFKLWADEKYFIDDRDSPLDDIMELPNIYTTYRKSLEPLRSRPRPSIPAPEQLPPLPPGIPPQKHPFEIPNGLDGLIGALRRSLDDDLKHDLPVPPSWAPGTITTHPFSGGETAAQERLAHLISSGAMSSYKATRNQMLGVDYSTKLSAFLAQGHITARQVHWAMMDFEEGRGLGDAVTGYGQGENDGTAAVRFELLWRDYMYLCARKFGKRMYDLSGIQDPNKRRKPSDVEPTLHSDQRPRKRWKHLVESGGLGDTPERTREVFARFRSGRTGVGLIDAANRELFLTGYTSNRARQNVASFLSNSSHLGIDWRVGAEWYEYLLLDYDMANNWGNWQYVAGVGNDPRQGRVFNPVKQALDYDPQGEYIKAWVPELRQITLTKNVGMNKEELDQQKLMGLYQAWRLSDYEKDRLGLRGIEWVESPLVKIQFSVGSGKGRGGQNKRGRGRGDWRGRGRGRGKSTGSLGIEEKLEKTQIMDEPNEPNR
ncbi:cryptochrome [Bimuria novae-zelandiae CBS 107.79]|uniref:Cryptochrome DASH n=1 Tax=Bimuria novae-zelandiae CBS 107.79 TaxID=1447943 RepID=A0A6A5VN47_9PLEO|nr:cryptochrome [Bimuria novae-zelandiae CBS 107.79]